MNVKLVCLLSIVFVRLVAGYSKGSDGGRVAAGGGDNGGVI